MTTAIFMVEVRQLVEVRFNPAKFTEDFLEEFRSSFYGFDTIEQHAEHIAQLQARGVIDVSFTGEFVEGYGPSGDMGINALIAETTIELIGGAA